MSSPDEPANGQLEPLPPAEPSDVVEPAEVVGGQLPLPFEVRVERHQQSLHMGPLPEASQLAEYDKILPGLADRIVRMAENEQGHRHRLETTDLTQPFSLARQGQVFGLVIAVLVLAFGCLLILTGSPILGAGVVGLDLVALVAVFVTGRGPSDTSGQQAASPEPDPAPPVDGSERPEISGS